MKKKPAVHPKGYRTITASLAVSDISAAIRFLAAAFDAEVLGMDTETNPGFAAVKIGNAQVFLTNGNANIGHLSPSAGTSAVSQHMYVEDVDATTARAVEAGAVVLADPADTFWGERTATIVDPSGHRWTIATRTEHLSHAEIAQRFAAVTAGDHATEVETGDRAEIRQEVIPSTDQV